MLTIKDKALLWLDGRYRIFRAGNRWLCVQDGSQLARFKDWDDAHAFIQAINAHHK